MQRLKTCTDDVDSSGTLRPTSFRMSFISSESLLTYSLILFNRCLGHVVNLGNQDVMAHITRIAAVEMTTAIWEYDPLLPDNRLLNGSLDVIAAIRSLTVKVRKIPDFSVRFKLIHVICRYRRLANELKSSIGCKLNAVSLFL